MWKCDFCGCQIVIEPGPVPYRWIGGQTACKECVKQKEEERRQSKVDDLKSKIGKKEDL